MKNKKQYTEKDLVEFGNYLLSSRRKSNTINKEDTVYHADLENWKIKK